MFEVKPMSVEKKEPVSGPDEGRKECGSGPAQFGLCGTDCESLYLYDSQDWVVSPSCSPEEPSAISPMLAEETFRYMILSADRVEQMRKTYNDIDVVTHLLAERDRDLELAARIGQSLLQRNHLLQERNEAVEEQLAEALDQVHQLQHELGKKDELLRMVASASEESETDSSCSTPLRHSQPLGASLALSQLEALQSKLQELEEENLALRSEASHLKTETMTYEEKEQQLVSDCVKELRETNSQMVSLTDELAKKNEELLRHQEEMAQLLSQIVDLQQRVKELALEKEELRIHLQASKDAQRQLTAELNELQDRNTECVGMLQESQEEIRELRNKSTPSAGLRRHLPYGLFPMDSLAAEIEGTMRRELSLEEESAYQDQRTSQKRVFQTVRSINESVRANPCPRPIPGSARSSVVMTAQPFQSGLPSAQAPCEEEPAQTGSKEEARLGQPGSPGGSDLVSALHRLSLRRQNFLCERQFFQAERDRKLQALSGDGAEGDAEGSGYSSPGGSVFSSVSNMSDLSSASCFKTFLPEKLQIVKPLEGSLTLHHWQQLAQPHLATILDPHPGVVTKGFRPLPQDAVYHLADLEEDEEEGLLREKGACERAGAEEEEEDGGITFQVQCASTPEERKERKSEWRPVQPLTPPRHASPTPPTVSGPLHPPSAPPASAAPLPPSSQILSTPAPSSAQNPGKCLSSTFSTYTFTTCRILHPCDVTQVTPSSLCRPSVSVSENTPSSLRTGPSTPVTPCRLSLGDSFPPHRSAAPRGLARLLLEKGISAQVSTKSNAPKPGRRLLPSTPPNSPSCSPAPSPVPFETRPASSDNFLASRPAELFLQEVYGLKLGRGRPDLPSPTQPPPSSQKQNRVNVNLVEKVCQLGFAKALQGAETDGLRRQDSATFLATGGGSLLDGLRRNQSLPAMVGGRGPPVRSPSHPAPTPTPARTPARGPHPTSLTLPIPSWGNLKDPKAGRTPTSPSQVQHPPHKV
ncbi:trafficking kinesin-binding protein 2-like isoform X2 [Megalops cyprinoides]|uniref:trafficking kinesin-binding protein 2-like isoform X2 n=1 Tax=Megalops cyprinoides TaxID=118141 RepID=UPI0018656085|nr:trafficking kinesin-binding protein 2-like isoform X2 [Megalops cyprinoides]